MTMKAKEDQGSFAMKAKQSVSYKRKQTVTAQTQQWFERTMGIGKFPRQENHCTTKYTCINIIGKS